MNKILLIILLLMVLGLSYTYNTVTRESSVIMNDEFLGPVPLGYDEEYFRETGITRLSKEKVGLYYNLDDESKVYVRNGEGFEEVKVYG